MKCTVINSKYFVLAFCHVLLLCQVSTYGQYRNSFKELILSSPIDSFIDITNHITILEDTTNFFTAENILEEYSSNLALDTYHFANKNINNAYWLKFKVKNQSHQEMQVVIKFTVLDSINLLQFENEELAFITDKGLLTNRTKLYNNNYPFDKYGITLNITPQKEYTFFIQIKNQVRFEVDKTRVKLYNKDFEARHRSSQLFYFLSFSALFFSIILFLIFFSIIQYRQTKETSYLYYAGYLLVTFLYFWWKFEKSNSVINILFTNYPKLYYYWELPLVILIYLTYLLFIQSFLDNPFKKNSFSANAMKYFTYGIPIYCVLNFLIIDFSGFGVSWGIYKIFRVAFAFLAIFILIDIIKIKELRRLTFYIFIGTFSLIIFGLFTLLLSTSFQTLEFLTNQKQHYVGPWDVPLIPVQIGVIIEIVFFSVGLSYKSKMLIEENAKISEALINQELKALKAQLNPHFIFNCLMAIYNLVEKKDTQNANRYIGKFALLHRSVLNFSDEKHITLQKEIEFIDKYISLEQLRFSNKFTYEKEIDDTLDLQKIIVPPLFSQPFVENAIKHGLLPKNNPPIQLKIVVKRKLNTILFCIDDTGVGRKKMNNNSEGGKGMKISRDRIHSFNKMNKTQIEYNIIDKKGEVSKPLGTLIKIKIPLTTNT